MHVTELPMKNFCSQIGAPATICNGGVSSLQVAAHQKPVLTLLRMHDILARIM
jgi:hypothetical protein